MVGEFTSPAGIILEYKKLSMARDGLTSMQGCPSLMERKEHDCFGAYNLRPMQFLVDFKRL